MNKNLLRFFPSVFPSVFLSVALVGGLALPVSAQDSEQTAVPTQDTAISQAFRDTLLTRLFLELPGSGLASEDGHYLAQDEAELQTYYDLGLSYRYINESYLRRQLELDAGQGIIVESADPSGQGYRNGLRGGDIVLKVDEEPVDTQYDLVQAFSSSRGSRGTASILRDGQPVKLSFRVSEPEQESDTPKRWIIGVGVDEISDLAKAQLGLKWGAAVNQLSEDGPAHQAGVLEYDIITHVGDQRIGSLVDLSAVVNRSAGQTLRVALVRKGKKIMVSVAPRETPVQAVDTFPWSTGRTIALDARLDTAEGAFLIVPTVVDATQPGPRRALAWAWQKNAPDDELASRLKEIEATLEQLKDQIRQLQWPRDK